MVKPVVLQQFFVRKQRENGDAKCAQTIVQAWVLGHEASVHGIVGRDEKPGVDKSKGENQRPLGGADDRDVSAKSDQKKPKSGPKTQKESCAEKPPVGPSGGLVFFSVRAAHLNAGF